VLRGPTSLEHVNHRFRTLHAALTRPVHRHVMPSVLKMILGLPIHKTVGCKSIVVKLRTNHAPASYSFRAK
jgi:hypothetical protein